jgi:hypothetical protein
MKPDTYKANLDDLYHLPKDHDTAVKHFDAAVKKYEAAAEKYNPIPLNHPTLRESLAVLAATINPIGEVCIIAALTQVNECLELMSEKLALLENEEEQKVTTKDSTFKYPVGWLCTYTGSASGVCAIVSRFLTHHDARKYVIEFRGVSGYYCIADEDQLTPI